MVNVLFGVFLIVHGAIHLLWFVPAPDDPKWPFTTSRSPLLPFLSGQVLRPLAVGLVVLIIAGYSAAALGLFGVPGLSQSWGTAAIVASALSAVTCALFWNNQLIAGPLIDIAIIAAVVMGWPKAAYSVPAPYGVLGMRLANQLIERPASGDESAAVAIDPPDVVRHLCAMQAQDYAGSLWSVGLRSGPDCTAADVERAIAERRIVRTWPMRGTLHLLAPEDVRWMLALLSPRVLARARGRHEQLGITESTIERARAIFTDALSGGRVLTRAEMMALLEAEGLDTTGQRGYHVLWTLAQQAVLCCGPIAGKQQTFVLLDEWVPPSETEPPLKLEAALGHLAKRYFEARGPATIADFAWWAGIRKAEARDGVESAGPGLRRDTTGGTEYWVSTESGPEPAASVTEARPESRPVHLLPGFDEYFLGYTDRSLQLDEHREAYGGTVSANGMFSATLIISGRVAGTWKRTLRRDRVDITVRAFRPLTSAEMSGLADAAARYGRFLGLEANVLV